MKGTFSGTHWLEDSLYIPEDLFQQMELEKIFNICLNHFSYFGVTTVIPREWNNVKQVTKKIFHVVLKLLLKLTTGFKYVLKQKNASLSAEYNTVALS